MSALTVAEQAILARAWRNAMLAVAKSELASGKPGGRLAAVACVRVARKDHRHMLALLRQLDAAAAPPPPPTPQPSMGDLFG